MASQATWPRPAAARAVVPPARAAERYQRAETLGPAPQGDTAAALGVFSGRPDCVILSAVTFGVIFSLDDLDSREICEVTVPGGQVERVYLNPRSIRARNAVGAQVGVAMAVGLWAERGEAAHGNP